MQFNLAYYVHHHGNGHFMRALAIAGKMPVDYKVTLIGSGLQRFRSLIPKSIECIELPLDIKRDSDHAIDAKVDLEGLHYAPYQVSGQSERVSILAQYFSTTAPLLLIVDVSVEIAMLARLCGIPYLYIRQHGIRTDLPHTIAYKNALGIIAPFHKDLDSKLPSWMRKKVFYSGCFSRFDRRKDVVKKEIQKLQVLLIAGGGGTSLDADVIHHICKSNKDFIFTVIGLPSFTSEEKNIESIDKIADPSEYLLNADVVIGSCGHNVAMEVATFYKPFIAIPENRPFSEQLSKASILAQHKLAHVVLPENIYTTDWASTITKAASTTPNWEKYFNDTAIEDISIHIDKLYNNIFASMPA